MQDDETASGTSGPATRTVNGPGRPGAPRPSTVRPSTTGSIGLLLAGRYRLDERRGRDGDSSTWDGRDTQLERRVIIRVVSGRAVPAALEAARVAAAHHAPGLTRILDTGDARATDGTVLGWIVEERPAGERLDDLVRRAPLDGERARVVIGEAARALADAAASGCHHRRLAPSSLYVHGRSVVVSGLVVAAAAAGLDPVDEDGAMAEDGLGLASLLYAALTGLWPHGRVDAVGAAPRSRGAAVPPRDLVPDVPPVLDELVVSELSPSEGGGVTPQQLADSLLGVGPASGAAQVQPGSRREIRLPDTRQVPVHEVATPARVGAETDVDQAPGRGQHADDAENPPDPGGDRDAVVPTRRGARRAAREERDARGTPPGVLAASPSAGPGGASAQDPTGAVAGGGGTDDDGAPTNRGGSRSRERLRHGVEALGSTAETALARSHAAVRSAVGPVPQTRAAARGRRPARDQPTVAGAGPRPVVPAVDDAGDRRTGGDAGPDTHGEPGGLPLIETVATPEAASGPSHLRGRTVAIALSLVVVVLLVALLVAFRQVPTLQSVRESILGATEETRAAPSAAPGGDTAEEAEGEPAPGPAPVLTGATALDPQGDGAENGDRAQNAVDGDPGTAWTSEGYATAAFGNLKEGVGLQLDLEADAAVSEVEVDSAGDGGAVEIRTSPTGSFEDSTVVAQSPLDGSTTITVDPPATTSHLIVWWTELPSTTGGYRAEVSEITVR